VFRWRRATGSIGGGVDDETPAERARGAERQPTHCVEREMTAAPDDGHGDNNLGDEGTTRDGRSGEPAVRSCREQHHPTTIAAPAAVPAARPEGYK
jgi:hypothetical protein